MSCQSIAGEVFASVCQNGIVIWIAPTKCARLTIGWVCHVATPRPRKVDTSRIVNSLSGALTYICPNATYPARRVPQFHPAWWSFWRARQDETGHSFIIVSLPISNSRQLL